MIATFFGVIREGVGWLFDFTKMWIQRCLVGIVLGLTVAHWAEGTVAAGILVPLGTGLWLISVVGLMIAVALPKMAIEAASERYPLFGTNVRVITIAVVIGMFWMFAVTYGRLTEHPDLYRYGVWVMIFLFLSLLLPGAYRSMFWLDIRLAIGLTALMAGIIYANIPPDTKTQIRYEMQKWFGALTPTELSYTLESLENGQPPFFKSIPDSQGQPIPNVWWYYDKDQDKYHLYDRPGTYANGEPYNAPQRNTARIIIGYLKEQKLKAEEELKRKQAEMVVAETARQAAQKPPPAAVPEAMPTLTGIPLEDILESKRLRPGDVLVRAQVLTRNVSNNWILGQLTRPVRIEKLDLPAFETTVLLNIRGVDDDPKLPSWMGNYQPIVLKLGTRQYPIRSIERFEQMARIPLPASGPDTEAQDRMLIRDKMVDIKKMGGTDFTFILHPLNGP